MAAIEDFNDHCWKDVIPADDLKLYSGWRRETFVGPRPALLARPPELITATAELDEVQLAEVVRFRLLPSLNVPLAVN